MIFRKPLLLIAFLLLSTSVFAQTGFYLLGNKKRSRIRFELVNNLPVVQVEINGAPLSFILDTGVKASVLFSLEAVDSIQLNNSSPVKLRGLGAGDHIEALRSLGNTVKLGNAIDVNHLLFIIFDSNLNFSPRMGIPIHGILGNDFFENFIVKIDYAREMITLYDPEKYSYRNCRKCEDFSLEFVEDKPYLKLMTFSDGVQKEINLLVDSGSSDVLWLFDEEDFIKESPRNYFQDFLGLGLGGDIFGKRTRIPELRVGSFLLEHVNTSFPEETAVTRARLFEERDGSIGGGFLRRFTVIFDYSGKRVRFKKNNYFDKPFHYDMSGLIIEHEGVELIKSEKQTVVSIDPTNLSQGNTRHRLPITTELEFSLVPQYIVVHVREGSAAAEAGIRKGDKVLTVKGRPSYKYKLYELIELFSNDEGKEIKMEIERNGMKYKVKFELESVF